MAPHNNIILVGGYNSFSPEDLILAMAPIDQVIEALDRSWRTSGGSSSREVRTGNDDDCGGNRSSSCSRLLQQRPDQPHCLAANADADAAAIDNDRHDSNTEQQQEAKQSYVARVLYRYWAPDHDNSLKYRPSKRYLSALVLRYIRKTGEDNIRSELLLQLLLETITRGTTTTTTKTPSSCSSFSPTCSSSWRTDKEVVRDGYGDDDNNNNNDDAGYVSFRLVRADGDAAPPTEEDTTSSDHTTATATSSTIHLRLRVFPHHNDVALRMWEAGTVLAEYLLHIAATRHEVHGKGHIITPNFIQGRNVVELGAGVGLAGLVAAGCGARSVLLTDCSRVALCNLQHNIAINQPWLQQPQLQQRCGGRLQQQPRNGEAIENNTSSTNNEPFVAAGYLEWGAYGSNQDDDPLKDENGRHHHGAAAYPYGDDDNDGQFNISADLLEQADVILAADVAYDAGTIDSLVRAIHRFLVVGPPTNPTATSYTNKKFALLAATVRNGNTFALLERKLASYQLAATPEISPSDLKSLPIRFPLSLVQPRTDVRIFRVAESQKVPTIG